MNYSGEQVLNQCLDRTDPNNPALRTTTPAGAAAATTENDANGTLGAAGSATWAANANRRSLVLVNTGATNSLYVAAGATCDNTKFELKPGAGIRFDNNDGSAQKQRTIFSTGGTTYSYVEVIA